ncbi:hypothetical protein CPB86DRAFT_786587 [Serendipita vermifera]|nr:hypothetical protein CPB86DRAFT_786587 [Serendipita vermifera]
MLIEQIDNANDIENMQMWEPIIKLLESTEEDIQVNALWIMGTAVQNNPKAQAAFLTHAPLPRVFDFLRSQEKTTSELKAKALYCISNVLKHNRTAVDQMEGLDGWKLLHDSLIDSNANVRRKTAFLFNSLLLPDGSAPHQPLTSTTNDLAIHAMEKHNVPSTLINAVTSTESATSDEDFEEKAARAILSFLEAGGRLNAEDATRLKDRMKGQKVSSRWGLTREEWDSLLARSSQNT